MFIGKSEIFFKEKGTGKFRWLAEASNFSKNNFQKTIKKYFPDLAEKKGLCSTVGVSVPKEIWDLFSLRFT